MRELLHARRSATALLASVSLATCALAQRTPTIRDSAGVRIVEHGLLSQRAAPFRIGVDATVDLDVLRDDPDEELTARRPYLTGRRLSDGRWILIDFATLKLYDERARYVRTIGRKGSGPGEFRQLREVCVAPGDTIIGISLGDRRISTFDSTGKHVRSIVAPGSVLLDPCFRQREMSYEDEIASSSMLSALGILSDGRIATVHFDAAFVNDALVAEAFLSVIDPKTGSGCIDLPLTTDESVVPVLRFVGDRLYLVEPKDTGGRGERDLGASPGCDGTDLRVRELQVMR